MKTKPARVGEFEPGLDTILHPSAAECQTKEEFLEEDVERLRQLSVLAAKQCPAEVDRLTEEFPQVSMLLARRFG